MGKVTRLVTSPEIEASVRELSRKIHDVCSEFFLEHERDNANPAASIVCGLVNELTTLAVLCKLPVDDILDHVTEAFEARAKAFAERGREGLVE